MLTAVAVFTALIVLAAARLGGSGVDRTRAQTVADAVALAGVTHGRAMAERIAGEHGAVIVTWRANGPPGAIEVLVDVGYDGERASARATNRLDGAGRVSAHVAAP